MLNRDYHFGVIVLAMRYEIKSGATYSPDFFKGISKWAKLSNTPTEQCFAIYNGDKDIKTSVGQVNGWNHFSLF